MQPPLPLNMANIQKDQESMIHGACFALDIEPHGGGISSQGQTCLSMGQKSAARVTALCFARWGWAPTLILFDVALPKLRKGVFIATDCPRLS